MSLPPVHEVRGRSALKAIRANNLEFFASARQPGREIVRLQIGPPKLGPELFMNYSPEAAELMFSAKSYQNFPKENRVYRQIRLTMGDGILTAWGDDWIRQKTFIQPIFTRARVEGYLDPILEELNKTVEQLRSGSSTVDIGSVMQHFTLRVVCRVLFGADLNADEEAVIEKHFPALNKLVIQRASLAMPLPFHWQVGINKKIHESRNALFRLCDDVIARRRANPGGDDLASLLVAARDGDDRLTDAEIRDQILIFLLAGHETTSTSLTFAFHLLGRHPEEQEKVLAEVESVIGNAMPTVAQINTQMPYTTAVLKEAMRLYPAAPITGRRSIEATTISGHDVPAGSDVIISVWNIHRREDLWPDPLRFDPERFIGTDIGRYAWLPFGAGPRACIGQHFSMLESIAAIAMIVKAFRIEAVEASDHLPVGSGITLYPLAPVRVEVTAR